MTTFKQYKQLFFIEGRMIGETTRKPVYYHEQLAAPPSLMWICRVCGEVYARAPVTDPTGKVSEFHTITRLCRKHTARTPTMYETPGSLWLSWDKDFLAELPVPVLQYELERHIEHFERLDAYYERISGQHG